MTTLNCPDDFDEADIAYAAELVPDGAVVTQMLTVVAFMDPDGMSCWRAYNASGEGERIMACIGMLELAKLDLIARAGCMPDYPDDDD